MIIERGTRYPAEKNQAPRRGQKEGFKMRFEKFWETQPTKYIDGAKELAEQLYTAAADWWILGADMWLADGQDHPVPETWPEAAQESSNSNNFPCVEEHECAAWLVRNMLSEYAETGSQHDLLEILDAALEAGEYAGWEAALAAQKKYYGEA